MSVLNPPSAVLVVDVDYVFLILLLMQHNIWILETVVSG